MDAINTTPASMRRRLNTQCVPTTMTTMNDRRRRLQTISNSFFSFFRIVFWWCWCDSILLRIVEWQNKNIILAFSREAKKIRRMRTTREMGEKRRKWLVRQMLQLLIIMNWTINAIVWMRSMLLFSIYILFFISHIICCRRVNYLLVDVFVRVCVRRCRVRYAVRSIDLSESMLRISHSSRMHAEEPMKSRKN